MNLKKNLVFKVNRKQYIKAGLIFKAKGIILEPNYLVKLDKDFKFNLANNKNFFILAYSDKTLKVWSSSEIDADSILRTQKALLNYNSKLYDFKDIEQL